ncbi:hypothetical protein Poli38472_009275 [Pythium oligandrum]|uniref:Uncharacterized protein n=1 Tax=Pythium oligandrum TaxID=41045 RepID=A0A8K1CMM8_PYTOL|nr:hypothetical protein Poli38472_009275 [Pythium oligandrum]|eukprot:TMW65108.1 hypothetical protein Poli38472_009275 [Pythium oligandrum]
MKASMKCGLSRLTFLHSCTIRSRKVEAVDEGSDVLIALPTPGWFTTIVTAAYSVVSITMIARGIVAVFLQSRIVRYIPNDIRYSKKCRLAWFLLPFMPIDEMLTDDERSVITFKGSLMVASDVWMNHWLYINLSMLNAIANLRLTYCTLQLGTWYLRMKVTLENFLFLSLNVFLKLGLNSLRSMQLTRNSTRERIESYIDGSSMFLSFKIYNLLLCIILFFMMQTRGTPTFMKRQSPYKVGTYGGIPEIELFWESELMCDLVSLLLRLGASGQLVGILLMLTRFRKVTHRRIMHLLRKRFFFVGWDGLMAAQLLGMDPT